MGLEFNFGTQGPRRTPNIFITSPGKIDDDHLFFR